MKPCELWTNKRALLVYLVINKGLWGNGAIFSHVPYKLPDTLRHGYSIVGKGVRHPGLKRCFWNVVECGVCHLLSTLIFIFPLEHDVSFFCFCVL